MFELGFNHDSVCHKYEFINILNSVNIQTFESFNNCIKLGLKIQKGVLTKLRSDFHRVFLFFYNNKENILEKGLDLILLNKWFSFYLYFFFNKISIENLPQGQNNNTDPKFLILK
ncbi:hypothetical protein H312_00894 [Anncaliia algerae PRA339]|uniref:Uncharacterized protein n=1 Tax=Anncaliia algerae PRA339 TaxID=1288291 RepID=A0A059F435_9MICR|nr:hypothetical protein H312_00894 [Anncaliia algerae PRA339]